MKIVRHENSSQGDELERLFKEKYEELNPPSRKFSVHIFERKNEAITHLNKRTPKKDGSVLSLFPEDVSLSCYVLSGKVEILAVLDELKDVFEVGHIDYVVAEEMAHLHQVKDLKEYGKIRGKYWAKFMDYQYKTKLAPHEPEAGEIILELYFELNALDLLVEKGYLNEARRSNLMLLPYFRDLPSKTFPVLFSGPAVWSYLEKRLEGRKGDGIRKLQDIFWEKTPMNNKEQIRKNLDKVVDTGCYKTHQGLAEYLLE